MNCKKLLVIGMAVLAFGFAAVPQSKAGVSIGIGIGVPVGYGYGYAHPRPLCYPYGYGYAPYGYRYGYARPVVNVYVRPHYHWRHHRRVHCTSRHR
ncbi:MAG: hypothetical protein M3R07_10365 [Gemmatimonadota bacterium]|nr:hypothetical protein [Gemmatimonadota bacterium]